jgi:hypothetical protein
MIKTEEGPLAMHNSPRCGAKCKRTGKPCRMPAMDNGRCFLHGGKSTGPRTPKGIEKCRKAPWKHGIYSKESLERRNQTKFLIKESKKLLSKIESDEL